MRQTLARVAKRTTAWTTAAIVAVAILAAIAVLVPTHTKLAVAAAAAVAVVGLTFVQPAALPIVAMPLIVVVERVGGDAANLSLSDAALFAAFWPALLLAPRPFTPPMRSLLWASAVFQALTLFTVIANPYRANLVEWFHMWLLVAGALVVGWAIGRRGLASLGLGLFVAACSAIAVLTCLTALRQMASGSLQPVYLDFPFYMHKNFIGCTLAFAALVVYVRPRWLGWSDRLCLALFVLLGAGVVASQARQAIIGLGVAIVVVVLRRDPDHPRSRLILLGVIPAVVVIAVLAREQLASDNEFNSASQRLTWFDQAFEIWRSSPWFGVGLRWWYTDRFTEKFQPPNAEVEVLTSTGVVGLIGFLVLVVAALVVLWRVHPRYGMLAFAMVLMRLVQGQLDLFWTAVHVSIPFAVAGIALGAQAWDEEHRPPPAGASRTERAERVHHAPLRERVRVGT